MKRVELIVTVADAGDFDIAATEAIAFSVPDHFSAGHACREAIRRLKDVAGGDQDDDE